MLVEREENNDFIIRLSASIGANRLQKVLDYIRYLELSSKSKASKADAEDLAEKVNASWWSKNRKRYIK